ncbi:MULTISPECIES: hypothetical protein [unclassified Streptomyces]|uniref:hypothetical protein n=1 Tax=unclassified Streptomyces TaxID=2593676 RepID=UPI003D70C74F
MRHRGDFSAGGDARARPGCGAVLPPRRRASHTAAAGRQNDGDTGAGRGWLRLPGGGRRRVDTIRVRRLFG